MTARRSPRDDEFFARFSTLAAHVDEAARLAHGLFGDPATVEAAATRIAELAEAGDEVARAIGVRVDTSFVTPLGREDTHLLASRLDRVLDLVNGAARRAHLFAITERHAGAVALGDVLVRATAVLRAAVADMRDAEAMRGHARAMRALEAEGDARYGEALAGLFTPGADPLAVIRWKDLLEILEAAIDQCHEVVALLESIALTTS